MKLNIDIKVLILLSLWCLVLGYLKVEGIVDWSWIAVFSPVWILFVIGLASIVIIITICMIGVFVIIPLAGLCCVIMFIYEMSERKWLK